MTRRQFVAGSPRVTGTEIEVPDSPQRIVAIHDANGGLQVLELGFPLVGMATRGGGFDPGGAVMADFAELLGAQDRLAEIAGEYEAELAALRDELAPVADRLSAVFVAMNTDAQLGLRGENATPLTVTLTALGIVQPAVTDSEGPDGFPSISLELTPQIGADVIFFQGPGQDPELFADHTGNPLWQGLAAVQADQVLAVDERMSGQTYGTYAFVLGEVRPALVGADPDVFDEAAA